MSPRNPFETDPEKELQKRKKFARKITREEFLNPKKAAMRKPANEKT